MTLTFRISTQDYELPKGSFCSSPCSWNMVGMLETLSRAVRGSRG